MADREGGQARYCEATGKPLNQSCQTVVVLTHDNEEEEHTGHQRMVWSGYLVTSPDSS